MTDRRQDGNRIERTLCRICDGGCGLLVEISGGKVVAVKGDPEHPANRGTLCPKGKAIPQITNAPDRLLTPLRRTGAGGFEPLGWDDAVAFVAERLLSLRERYGPQAAAFHMGEAGLDTEYGIQMRRVARFFGTPNFSHAGSHCFEAKDMAWTYTFGALPAPDIARSRCVVLWGVNPSRSCLPDARLVRYARKQGAALIVVDPVVTNWAREADVHLQLKPGSDVVLGLGLIGSLIRNGLEDAEATREFGHGFDKLAERALEFTPERVFELTGVPSGLVEAAARLCAERTPACVVQGVGLDHHLDAFQQGRAVACFAGATGNVGRLGGMVFHPPLPLGALRTPAGRAPRAEAESLGLREHPLYVEHTRTAQANVYAKAVLEDDPYPLRGLLVSSGNPALSWPGSAKVTRALKTLELLVVVDQFMSDTARCADLVIPAPAFLEYDQLIDRFSHSAEPVLELGRGVVPPACGWGEWEFWTAVGRELGYEDAFPWKNEQEAINARLSGVALDVDTLSALAPVGFRYGEVVVAGPGGDNGPHDDREPDERGALGGDGLALKTPSGKIEYFSDTLMERGYDPLPGLREPPAEIATEFPFVLTSGARVSPYLLTRFRNVPALRALEPQPKMEVHTADAAELGLADGDLVRVESPVGVVELPARLSERLPRGVVTTSQGWSEPNINLLSTADELDPVTGFPCYRSIPVKLAKV